MSVSTSTAGPADRPAAVRGLVSHLPEPDRTERVARILTDYDTGHLDPSGLIVARRAGRVVGAAVVQVLPGHTAAAWPPWAEDSPAAAALARAVAGRLAGLGVTVAHGFGRETVRERFATLQPIGFRRVTELTFLSRPIPGLAGLPPFDPAACRVRFTPVPGPTPEFGAVLLDTYEGTRDCPELNGTRTAADVLAGYAAGGAPARESPDWFLIRRAGERVGVLLFGPPKGAATAELSYLGLVPAARGSGLGDECLRFALRHAAGTGAEWLTLSVDVRNVPALRLYERYDFRPYDTQDVYLWTSEPNRG
jgi:ribosomal protein S18 acetylase RimI-like enzyme